MFSSIKKMISGRESPRPCLRPGRRPPSTPPLPLRSLQLVAKQPETAVTAREHRRVGGRVVVVRESWPGAGQRLLAPPFWDQPITALRPRTIDRPPLAPPPPGSDSEAAMMSLLLFCHSISSNSLIAIDNKIEQAMDLVKSHLMLAVREEVELLRDQIRELQEKNQQLERENIILRTITHT